MKKSILTLVLALLTTVTFSQYAFSLTIGVRENSDERFTFGKTKIMESNIPIKFDGKDITIYTEDTQYYQTLMPEYETENGTYWLAYDVNMKKCKFYMLNSDEQNLIMIEYEDVCIIYGVNYE
jgi:hypothetical protein